MQGYPDTQHQIFHPCKYPLWVAAPSCSDPLHPSLASVLGLGQSITNYKFQSYYVNIINYVFQFKYLAVAENWHVVSINTLKYLLTVALYITGSGMTGSSGGREFVQSTCFASLR